MGFSLNLGGGKSKSSTSSSSSTVATSMDAAAKAQLDELTSLLLGKVGAGADGAFSKESALKDVSGVVQGIFSEFRDTTLPQLFDASGSAGVFNSTALQRMADNAFGQAVGKAAGVTLDAIKSYAGIEQAQQGQQLEGLLQALGLQSNAYKTESSTGSSFTKAKGSSFSLGGDLPKLF